MEMPIDIINKHLADRLAPDFVDPDEAAWETGIRINDELKEKFYFIPQEEVDAVPIEKISESRNLLHFKAGSGAETIRARKDDNPNWLYQSAVHALAMMQFLQAEQDRSRIPEPGVYMVNENGDHYPVIVTEDRRVMVPQVDDGCILDRTNLYRTREVTFQRIDTVTGQVAE